VGVLTDVDRLYDFYRWNIRRKNGQIFLFLHAWEYSLAGLLLAGLVYHHPVLLAAALAQLGHVAADHFHNRLSPWGYFLTYRAWTGFDVARIAPDHNVLDSYRSWPKMVPFGRKILPWYQRNIEPWFHSRTHG
jgi:hypothetical protein